MERLGMRREAHFREHAFVKGGWDEELIYAMLEDEWRAGAASAKSQAGLRIPFARRDLVRYFNV